MLVKTLSAQLSLERNACKSALLTVTSAREDFSKREKFYLSKIKELEAKRDGGALGSSKVNI